jgi:hypothetical protein
MALDKSALRVRVSSFFLGNAFLEIHELQRFPVVFAIPKHFAVLKCSRLI